MEVDDMVKEREISLASFDDLPAEHEELQSIQSRLLELEKVLQVRTSSAPSHFQKVQTTYFQVKQVDIDRLNKNVQKYAASIRENDELFFVFEYLSFLAYKIKFNKHTTLLFYHKKVYKKFYHVACPKISRYI